MNEKLETCGVKELIETLGDPYLKLSILKTIREKQLQADRKQVQEQCEDAEQLSNRVRQLEQALQHSRMVVRSQENEVYRIKMKLSKIGSTINNLREIAQFHRAEAEAMPSDYNVGLFNGMEMVLALIEGRTIKSLMLVPDVRGGECSE